MPVDKFLYLNEAAGRVERRDPVVVTSGVPDAGRIVATNPSGVLDFSLIDGSTLPHHYHDGADITSGVVDISYLPVAADGVDDSTKLVRADDSRLGATTLGGDVTGVPTDTTVVKIQNISIDTTDPTAGQVLRYENISGKWKPDSLSDLGNITIQEDDGSPVVSSVVAIRVGNGDLTDLGEGVVRLKTAADASGGGSGSSSGADLYLWSHFH